MSIPGCLEFSDTYELRVGGTLVSVVSVLFKLLYGTRRRRR